MLAALYAVPAATSPASLPMVVTLALATVLLAIVAVSVRRLRRERRLTGVSAVASAVSAAGIFASALLVTVALGSATAASAQEAHSPSVTVHSVPASHTGIPDDYQLPTE